MKPVSAQLGGATHLMGAPACTFNITYEVV
jgi:hypothetical protein